MELENEVARHIDPGLEMWRDYGAKVDIISKGSLFIPRIYLPSQDITANGTTESVLWLSGQHNEETSGPIALLNPKNLNRVLLELQKRGLAALIYPIINNNGLRFPETADPKLLRFNSEGLNYNDGWGKAIRAEEVAIVEADIRRITKTHNFRLACTFHEDSTLAGKGYFWTNGIDIEQRRKFVETFSSLNGYHSLAQFPPPELKGAAFEQGSVLVDFEDAGSLEAWLSEKGIPTITVEAPFGMSLEQRLDFQNKSIAAAIESLI